MVLGIMVVIVIVEFWGSYTSSSLALLSDAFHVIVDAIAIIVGIAVERWSVSTPAKEDQYRHQGCYIHVFLLRLIGLVTLVSAIYRFFIPLEIIGQRMLMVAVVGFGLNLLQRLILYLAPKRNITVKGLNKHVLTDLLQSAIVILAAILINATGLVFFDPIASIIIVYLMFWWAKELQTEQAQ